MNDFNVFDDFRVCAWVSDGIVLAARHTKAVVKRAGAKAIVAIAVLATPMSFAATNVTIQETQILLAVAHGDEVSMNTVPKIDQGVSLDVARLSADIDRRFDNRHNVTESDVAPETLALAKQALERINASGMVFSQEWADRIANTRA